MILTTCSVCAAPLADDAPAHCVNCQTRYCSDRCLRYHAHRGGHDETCEEIHSGGGAEQYHADKKYKEAVADAVEACRGRHEGPDVLYLHGGCQAAHGRGPRERILRVPRDVWLRTRVVLI